MVVLQLALQLRGLRWPACRVEFYLTWYRPGALFARWVFSFLAVLIIDVIKFCGVQNVARRRVQAHQLAAAVLGWRTSGLSIRAR